MAHISVSSDYNTNFNYPSYREIKSVFCVGQVEPQREVYPPNSHAFVRSEYLRFQFEYMCYHVLRKLSRQSTAHLTIKNVHEMFPTATEKIIKKVLTQIAVREKNPTDNKATGYYIKNEDKDLNDYRTKISVEDVISYESVRAGLQRLYDVNIFRLTKDDVGRIVQALQVMENLYKHRAASALALKIGLGEEKLKGNKMIVKLSPELQKELAAARFVSEELQCTPWYLSTCYVNMHLKQGQQTAKFPNMMMRLKGVGDPSGKAKIY